MKKIACIFAALCALLLLTACGGGSGSTGGTASANGGAPAEAAAPAGSGVSAGAAEADTAGYVFTSGGTEIVIDALAAPILDALGEPVKYYEAASCAFEGLDKFYTYGSFEVQTYPDADGADRIALVELKDDLVSTAEGLSIGAAYEEIIEAYGTGGQEDGSSLVYEKGGMKLMFIIGGEGLVESIQYQTKALDA